MKDRFKLSIVIVLLFGIQGFAQPFNLDEKINPIRLELQPIDVATKPDVKGGMAITEAQQIKDTMYYFVDGLSIYSPTYVSVTTSDDSEPLEVSLHKMNWHQSERSDKTNGEGEWSETFRTEMDFGLRIIANDIPAKYTILVWSGVETDFELPPIFKKQEKVNSETGAWDFIKDYGLFLVIGLLIIIILLLILKRRK